MFSFLIYFIVALVWFCSPCVNAADFTPIWQNGPTGSVVADKTPVVQDTGLKEIFIDTYGQWNEGSAKYIVTKDIIAPSSGLFFGGRWNTSANNIIVDLRGHTITFGATESSGEQFGIFSAISSNVLIKNGIIVQGTGNAPDVVGIRLGSNSELDNVTVVVNSNGSRAVVANGSNGLLHDCFIVNTSVLPSTNSTLALLLDRSTQWDVYRNTIIGGHSGITASPSGNTPYSSAHSIHHNLIFGTKRIQGFKSPHGIVLYAASDNAVFENSIITKDARGINVQMGSDGNMIYNNLVDARYTTTALPDIPGYPENNVYAYWQRHGARNSLHHNRLIASNFTTEVTAATECVVIGNGTSGTELLGENHIDNNTLWSFPSEAAILYSSGIAISKGGPLVTVKNNDIYSRTQAVDIEDTLTEGVVIQDNMLFEFQPNWNAMSGSRLSYCAISGNQTVTLTAHNTIPNAPSNLQDRQRYNAVELSWTPNTESFVRGYYVYRNGEKLETWIAGGAYFVDLSPLDPSMPSQYYVTAVSFDGKESQPSNRINLNLITTKPNAPSQLRAR